MVWILALPLTRQVTLGKWFLWGTSDSSSIKWESEHCLWGFVEIKYAECLSQSRCLVAGSGLYMHPCVLRKPGQGAQDHTCHELRMSETMIKWFYSFWPFAVDRKPHGNSPLQICHFVLNILQTVCTSDSCPSSCPLTPVGIAGIRRPVSDSWVFTSERYGVRMKWYTLHMPETPRGTISPFRFFLREKFSKLHFAQVYDNTKARKSQFKREGGTSPWSSSKTTAQYPPLSRSENLAEVHFLTMVVLLTTERLSQARPLLRG